MTDSAGAPGRHGSPPLDREEWILLLDHWASGATENAALSAALKARKPALDLAWRSADGLRKELLTFDFLRDDRPTRRPPAQLAVDVFRRYAEDPAALAADAAAIRTRAALSPGPRPLNPPWTRDETLLALEVYLQASPAYVSEGSAAVVALSRLLIDHAALSGVEGAESYRNTAGVARKVNKFRASEAGAAPITVRGAQLEAIVWLEWAHRPVDLAIEAQRVRSAFGAGLEPYDPSGIAPSRGPGPSVGRFEAERVDGEAFTYLMVLDGRISFAGVRLSAEDVLIKVGRSRSPHRRLAEMNAGFPPGLDLTWRLHATRSFPDVWSAAEAERRLLQGLYREGATLGREFARASRASLERMLDR